MKKRLKKFLLLFKYQNFLGKHASDLQAHIAGDTTFVHGCGWGKYWKSPEPILKFKKFYIEINSN